MTGEASSTNFFINKRKERQTMSVLEAKNITKIFPGVKALEDVSVSFHKGEIHCIMGENGAGKSTLIKCLTGVYKQKTEKSLSMTSPH